MVLFFFPFAKLWCNCQLLSMAPKPLFPFWQAQYIQVFPLKHGPFCKLFAGLGSTIKSATSLIFLSSLTLAQSLPACPLHYPFFTSISLAEIVFSLLYYQACHTCSVLSCLCCHTHSLLLSSYLPRIGKIGKPSCSACKHMSQDTSHLNLHCAATYSLYCSLFGNYLSLYNFWSRPQQIARLLGINNLPPCPHFLEGFG